MRNDFIIDYADYTDLQDDIKNNFIIDYAHYTHYQDHPKICFIIYSADYTDILTTLTTLIYWLHWLRKYIDYTDYADILTTLSTLIYWLRWLRWYTDYGDYADIQLYMKNNFIIDYTDYAVMKGYYWQNIHQWLRWYSRVIVITDYVDYPVLHITIKTVGIFFRNFGVALHASLACNSWIWTRNSWIWTRNSCFTLPLRVLL